MNTIIQESDLIKYKNQINHWKSLRDDFLENTQSFIRDEVEKILNLDKDLLNKDISDEQICLKIKEIYEYNPEIYNEDYIKYSQWINDLRQRNPDNFKTAEDVILFKKISENNRRKVLFEGFFDVNPSSLTKEEVEEYIKIMKDKGYTYCE